MSKDTDKALDVIGQKLRLKEEIDAPFDENELTTEEIVIAPADQDNSTAKIAVTAKGAQIADVEFETTTFVSDYADGVVTVSYADTNNPLDCYVDKKVDKLWKGG